MLGEVERALVLLALLLMKDLNLVTEGIQLAGSPVTEEELQDELVSLLELLNTRSERFRGYGKTKRGVDALERVKARVEERTPDYHAARVAAGLPADKPEF